MTSLPISLPNGFIASISVGDVINVGQVIASKTVPTDEIINVPKLLGVSLKHAKKIIKKIPGSAVIKGDILASKKSLFGTKTEVLRSKVNGTVTRFERDSGNLIIKTSSDTTSKDIISPVDGTVTICNNREIFINTDKNVVIGVNANGDKVTGEIYVLQEEDSYHLNANAIGKIAVSRNFTREMILKGVGIGVAGIIGVGINDTDIEHLVEKKFRTPLIKIKEQDFKDIIQWKGKKVFLNPEAESIIFLQL
ncbi:MAG TPA: hypothetical protein VNA13_03125 [Xanthomonadales bacterium]|nr:hypothetical protein [Xanthomonadales bacterium]